MSVPAVRVARRDHRRRRAGPLAAALVAASVGLGAGSLAGAASTATSTTSTASGDPTTASTLAAAPATGGGCHKIVRFGTSKLTGRFGNRVRTVLVHVPRSYSATVRVPLVLNLHGNGSTAAAEENQSGLDAESELKGFIVAYPQALIRSGSGFDWNIPGEPLPAGVRQPANPPDDLAFLNQLVAQLEQEYCVDLGAVYATGFSGGARMTSLLACDDSNVFAAVAPVSGLRWPDPCPTVRAVPVLAIHGTADTVDPYRGHGQSYWTYSVARAALDWARQDDCRTHPSVRRLKPDIEVTEYRGCVGNAVVELYSLEGGGHGWPGGTTHSAANRSSALDADAVIWSFLSAHVIR
jgi:polyhydroxybutyrate depolymerase